MKKTMMLGLVALLLVGSAMAVPLEIMPDWEKTPVCPYPLPDTPIVIDPSDYDVPEELAVCYGDRCLIYTG